jgi:MFS family permease
MADATRKWAGLRQALERRDYRLFVAGQLVSLVGTWTQAIAQDWLVYRLTGSAFWLGVTSFCQQAPAFLFASLGGVVADRHRRRTILLCTQSAAMVLAFVLAILTLTGGVGLAHVLVLAVLLGVVRAVDSPTRQAFVPDMVGRENLASAVALNTTMVTGASFLGPAIAGVTIKALGEGWCFLVNGASFLAVIAGLLAMRDLPLPTKGPARESLWARLHEGFRFAATSEGVRALLLLLALIMLVGMPFATLMPVFATTVLHGDARTLGLLMGAPGLGAILVGLVLASHRGTGSYRWVAGACWVFGVLLVLFSQARALWLAIAILIPMGAASMIQMTATNTLIQAMTPDALRGRVMAIWFMIFMGFAPVGSVIAGSITTALGPSLVIAVGGTVCALGGIGFASWSWTRPSLNDGHAPAVTGERRMQQPLLRGRRSPQSAPPGAARDEAATTARSYKSPGAPRA